MPLVFIKDLRTDSEFVKAFHFLFAAHSVIKLPIYPVFVDQWAEVFPQEGHSWLISAG